MTDRDPWKVIVLSDPEHEHLVAELHYEEQFILLLDRDLGRDSVRVAFPTGNGVLGKRVGMSEFIGALNSAAEDLKR